jgi:hypothetical protein
MSRSMVMSTVLCVSAALLGGVPIADAAGPLTITPSANPVPAGVEVSFQISPKVTVAGDSVTFSFGDGTTGSIDFAMACTLFGGCASIAHTYAGAGVFLVSATGTADNELFVGTGAHKVGFNNVNWRTDLEIQNPGPGNATYVLALLIRDADNSSPAFQAQFTLDWGRTVRYTDVLATVFGLSDGAAALRVTPMKGTIIVNSRTYNQLPSGTYGQFVPAIPRSEAIAWGQDARLIGLSHDPSLAAGYRTNIGLVNLSPAPITVEVDFYLGAGGFLGTLSYDLLPFEFIQTDKAFEKVTQDRVDDGYVSVKTTTGGAKFLAYASVIDNITGDPTYVPAIILP